MDKGTEMIIEKKLSGMKAAELLVGCQADGFEWPEEDWNWSVWADDVWRHAEEDADALWAFAKLLHQERSGVKLTARQHFTAFEQAYKGRFDTPGQYAEHWVDQAEGDYANVQNVPNALLRHVKWEDFADGETFNDHRFIRVDEEAELAPPVVYVFETSDLPSS